MIIFPRQVRDKRRESTLKKRRVFLQKRVSLGKHYASLAQKVFLFQFLNTVGLTVLLNSQFFHAGLPVVGDGKWYYTVGADLIQVMMMNVVVPPTVSDENIWCLLGAILYTNDHVAETGSGQT